MPDDALISKPEKLKREDLDALDKKELVEKYQALWSYINNLDSAKLDETLQATKESEEKLRQQHADATKREAILLKSLTEKEREISELANQIEELKQYQLPSNAQLRSMLLDPTVNVVFNRMKKELDSTKQRLEDSQSELSAWKFTPDSQTGKQLMARCRTLFKENEELGKQISQGRIAKLEGEIALEKKLVEEMKTVQADNEEFVIELDDDMEGMQATVYLLQQQLKETNERLATLTAATKGSQERTTVSVDHEQMTPTGGQDTQTSVTKNVLEELVDNGMDCQDEDIETTGYSNGGSESNGLRKRTVQTMEVEELTELVTKHSSLPQAQLTNGMISTQE